MTFTSCPKPEVKSLISHKIISQQPQQVKFTFFAPLYRSLIVKIYLQKGDPNLTFTSCPNRKSKFNKNIISTTKRRKFTIFCTIVQIVNFQKYLQKGEPKLKSSCNYINDLRTYNYLLTVCHWSEKRILLDKERNAVTSIFRRFTIIKVI